MARAVAAGAALGGDHDLEGGQCVLACGLAAVPQPHLDGLASRRRDGVVPYTGGQLDRICALQHERVVGNDNRVTVYERLDSTLSLGYGPHTLGQYDVAGRLLHTRTQQAA